MRIQFLDFKRLHRHPAFRVPLITITSLGLLTGVGIFLLGNTTPELKATDTHVVIINHDNTEQAVPTREKTVSSVLQRFNIPVHDGDVVEPALDTEVVTDNFRINVYRAVPVTIVDNGKKTFTYSAAATPRSIVKQAGIEVYPEDTLALLPTSNFLVEGSIGERVVINRATPVNVNIYGTPVQMRTLAKTVDQLLTERGLKLGEKDNVQPVKTTPISANMQIFLLRHGQQVVTEAAEIPIVRQIIEDSSLSFGTQATRQVGAPGKKLITYLVETKDGQQTRKVIQEITVQEAVPEIIVRGKAVQIPADKQAVMAAAGIAPSDYAYVDFIISHESGWCPTKLQGQVGYCPPYAPEVIPSGLGYGLGQATPGTKMAAYGADWKTSAATQLRWATSYSNGRYGSWGAAYNYWQAHHNW
ncbi:MAG TPA: ubiquitin-like domain-containing protein [Candidatus Saccharimonadales bacterium]|nr:ubiquitin-like domain-containing protein [Candidatus Saccharimonadales bacterium]